MSTSNNVASSSEDNSSSISELNAHRLRCHALQVRLIKLTDPELLGAIADVEDTMDKMEEQEEKFKQMIKEIPPLCLPALKGNGNNQGQEVSTEDAREQSCSETAPTTLAVAPMDSDEI